MDFIFVPKGQKYAFNSRSEPFKLLYRNSSFSDGAPDSSEMNSEARSLYDQIRSKDAYFWLPFTFEVKNPSIFMGK